MAISGLPTTAFGDTGCKRKGGTYLKAGVRPPATARARKCCVDAAPTGLARFDREMRYLAASHTYRDGHGLGDQDIVGRCVYDVVPE